jgi:phosphatidylserine decarboxylase
MTRRNDSLDVGGQVDWTRVAPWRGVRFEYPELLIGIGGLVLAAFFGAIWSPLFWPFAAAGVIVLLAGRDKARVPPEGDLLMVSPVDGIVADIGPAPAPRDLRLPEGDRTRIRIASSFFAANGVRAPAGGAVLALVAHAGRPPEPAFEPDDEDMSELLISIGGEGDALGLRIVTSALGPRLSPQVSPGQPVKLGQRIIIRRLGGWVDVFLPLGAEPDVRIGQTLVAAETPIARFDPVYTGDPGVSATP